MKSEIDLHVHSTISDGTYSPAALVAYAAQKGLRAIALTDHDTTEGIDAAICAAAPLSLEVIPGIEFSTSWEGRDIHIVGLGIAHNGEAFCRGLAPFIASRNERNERMMANMRAMGIDISLALMQEEFPESTLTRANFAKYLCSHGYAKNMKDAFARYVGDRAPCFVPREKVTPFSAIDLIHQGNGIAVLAHPMLYHLPDTALDRLVKTLTDHGLSGIEALYSTYHWQDETKVKQLARKYHLCISGGSDFHGLHKPDIDLGTGRGNLRIPYRIWEDLLSGRYYT